MKDLYVEYWKEQIQQGGNQGKLRTFKVFKTNFHFEKYITKVSNFKHRQAVTKLRISSHKLPVETGRYTNSPYNERICKHCNLNEVGNEQHYLLQCNSPKFNILRANFIQSLYKVNSSFQCFDNQDLFNYIMSMKDKAIMVITARYCAEILANFDQSHS